MPRVVNLSKIFGQDPFGFFTKSVNEALSVLNLLEKKLNDIGTDFRKAFQGMKIETGADVAKLEKEIENLKKTIDQLNDVKSTQVELNQELKKSQQEEEKQTKKTNKAKKESNKITEEQNKQIEEQINSLDELLKEQKKELLAVEDIKNENRELTKEKNKLIKELGKESDEVKKVTEEILDNQAAIKRSNKENRERAKLIDAITLLQEKEIKSLDDLKQQSAALRVVRNQLDLTLESNIELVAEFNEKIEENTEIFRENSTETEQNATRIGGYEQAINNALESNEGFNNSINEIKNSLIQVGIQLAENSRAVQFLGKQVSAVGERFKRLNTILKASIIGIVVAAVASLGAAFTSSRKGALELQLTLVKFQAFFKVFVGRLSLAGQGLLEIFGGISDFFSGIGDTFTKIGLRIQKAFIEVTDALTFSDSASKIQEIDKELAKIEKRQEAIDQNGNSIADGFGKIIDAFSNFDEFNKELDKTEKLLKEIAELEFEFADEARILQRELSGVNAELEEQRFIADDDTRALKRNLQAAKEASKLQKEASEIEIQLAEQELELANKKIQANLESKRTALLASGVSKSELNSVLENTELLINSEKLRVEVTEELLEAQQQAILNLDQVRRDAAEEERTRQEKARLIQRDLVEQNLDFLFDVFDRQKSLTEQTINNERIAVEERNRLGQQLAIDARKNFDNIVKEIESLQEKGSKAFDFDEILALAEGESVDDLKELNEFNIQ